VTITATPDAAFAPPRVEVEVAVPTGNIMSSVSVWRLRDGIREDLRTQPTAGLTERTVYDYECPRGVPVSYGWAAEYYDPDDNASTFSEPFTTFPGTWTGDTVSGSVSANKLTLLSPFKTINRPAMFAWDRITVAYLDAESTPGSPGDLLSPVYFMNGATKVFVLWTKAGKLMIDTPVAAGAATTIDAHLPFTVEKVDGGFVVSGTGGTATISGTYASITSITVSAAVEDVVVGAITASTIATTSTVAEESDTFTFDIDTLWLINPATPGLSVPVEYDERTTSVSDVGDVTQASNVTLHRPIGSTLAIAVAAGPRYGEEFPLLVRTETAAEETALRALLAPQVPILLLTPPDWGLGITDGYYSVGDVRRRRISQSYERPERLFTLPLVAVESPVVTVDNPGWSWAQLAAEFATWTEVAAAFATWADVASNTRRPGY